MITLAQLKRAAAKVDVKVIYSQGRIDDIVRYEIELIAPPGMRFDTCWLHCSVSGDEVNAATFNRPDFAPELVAIESLAPCDDPECDVCHP